MVDDSTMKPKDWREGGFDESLSREDTSSPETAAYIGGANFDVRLDDILFNRMIKFKDLRTKPQGNDPAKVYWDGANKKLKMWVDATSKWVDIVYTSTSTSTTSSSTSSTSTSSTSTSTT